jgi:RsiW-degrading membrane proteinase PrsW (M82 family)
MAPIELAPIIFAIAAGVIPAIFWLWFWLHEDEAHPEPKPLIGLVFVFGCLAVIPAFILEKALGVTDVLGSGNELFLILLIWAVIEEGLKFLAVYGVALKSRFYDEPVDAMIYMITAALGFAAVENTLFILSNLLDKGPNGIEYLLTGNFRFLGATLVHIVASALIGWAIGLTYNSRLGKKIGYFILGLTGAIVLHALFNYFIIKSNGGQIFKIFGLLWLAGVVIIFLFEKVKQDINQKTISSI